MFCKACQVRLKNGAGFRLLWQSDTCILCDPQDCSLLLHALNDFIHCRFQPDPHSAWTRLSVKKKADNMELFPSCPPRRFRTDSNRRRSFCRALPSHSATRPNFNFQFTISNFRLSYRIIRHFNFRFPIRLLIPFWILPLNVQEDQLEIRNRKFEIVETQN